MPDDQTSAQENPVYVGYGENKAYVIQDGTSAGDTKTRTGLENGTPEKPVQESRDGDVAVGLYATVDKNRMHKADTLF